MGRLVIKEGHLIATCRAGIWEDLQGIQEFGEVCCEGWVLRKVCGVCVFEGGGTRMCM